MTQDKTFGSRGFSRRFSMVAVPLLLAACATPFKADVSRFQQLPAPQGQSFAAVASDPQLQGGLEFSQYASIVDAQMARLGYTPSGNPATADLIVTMDYDVDNGREKIRGGGLGYGDPFGPWGFHPRGFYRRGHFAFGYHDPFFFGSRFGDIDSVTVYTSELDLLIDRRVDDTRVFEGNAQAISRSDRLSHLIPNLIEAMFTGFPGNSGETVRISIAPEQTTVRRLD